MPEFPLLRDFGIILAAAAAATLAPGLRRLPGVVAYILAGLALGPGLGLVRVGPAIELAGEVGVALLLFLVGLELSLERVRDVGRVVLPLGSLQVVATGAAGYALARALGRGPAEAAVLGFCLAISSTVVGIRLLEERGELGTLHGRLVVGVLIVQDLLAVLALTLLGGAPGAGGPGLGAAALRLLGALGSAILLGAVLVLLARHLARPLFRWLESSLEALFVWSLTWCFAAILAAHAAGLSVVIGAFLAGLALAQLPYNEELVRRVHPVANFFLAAFFVALGIRIDPGAALARWPALLALTAFVLAGKPLLLFGLIARFGFGPRTSVLAALALGQVSEFSFVVAALALETGIIGADTAGLVVAVGLVTIAASAVLIEAGPAIYARLEGAALRRLAPGPREEPAPPPRRAGHIVIVGMNTLGRRLVRAFTERGERVLAVDTDARKLKGLPCETLQGNADEPAVLERADLARAKLVVSTLQIEETNLLLVHRAGRLGVPSSIHAFESTLVPELRDAGATHLIVSKYDGIRAMADELRRLGVFR